MKIIGLQLVKPVGMSSTIEARHFEFEVVGFGIIARPKGAQSFSKKSRLIPWSNIAGCDIDEAAVQQELADQQGIQDDLEKERQRRFAEHAARVAQAEGAPQTGAVAAPLPDFQPPEATPQADDTVRFTKNPETGALIESRGPKVPETKSAFSVAAKAKAAKDAE